MNGRFREAIGVMAIIAALGLSSGAAADPESAAGARLNWSRPWLQPRHARAAAALSDEYAWRLFVAVNWPADWGRRRADARASLGADRPTVWETWANTADIFLDDGADPGPWRRQMRPPGAADASRFETISLKDLPNLRHVVGGRMVPFVDPVAGARRLTEIRMNRAAFEYIRARKLYNLDGQLKMLAQHGTVSFPAATTEVKAKWRPITAAEKPRYHTVEIRQRDGTTRLYGLTALHVVTKDLPDWFWATFEHVDNPALTDTDGWLLPSADHFACPAAQADCNRAPVGIGLQGTVWQYYRLRGTLTRYVDDAGQPLRLANSELEAGLQPSASCMTCHARSSIGLVAGSPVRLPIFDAQTGQDPVQRRGFLGPPRPEWFGGVNGEDGSATAFQSLDFVWSLSKARPKGGS